MYYFRGMSKPLDQLTKAELISLLEKREQESVRRLEEKEQEIDRLRGIVDRFARLAFAQKRERFEANRDQLPLPFEADPVKEEQQGEELGKKIEYIRKKQPRESHPGRHPLPGHLPVEEVEIHPEGDLSEMECIGSEVTEELDYVPAKLVVRRYIRYKYVPKQKNDSTKVEIGPLPSRFIEKGIAGTGLLASILTDKYVDHLPLYRQLQRFKREKIPIAASTMDGWVRQSLDRLEILYDCLLEDTRSKGYLQVDESTIKVLDGEKKQAAHLGYYWVYHNPMDGTVLFDYQKGRGGKAPERMLKDFRGYLQTDGYRVYESYGSRKEVTHLACWAHARREFFEAKNNDAKRAETALLFIQKLYGVEAHCREKGLDADQRKAYRLDHALPVLNGFAEWLKAELPNVLPKSAMGKAMLYSMNRWAELCNYLLDGNLEMDNNLIENTIRPLALGRKNYLFAGSHKGAERAAIAYSFFAMCKKEDINPYEWLKYVMDNIMDTNHRDIRKLYPRNYKKQILKL
ncbi:IS66-like element ISBf10 family transposase [Echinicola sediminis]